MTKYEQFKALEQRAHKYNWPALNNSIANLFTVLKQGRCGGRVTVFHIEDDRFMLLSDGSHNSYIFLEIDKKDIQATLNNIT